MESNILSMYVIIFEQSLNKDSEVTYTFWKYNQFKRKKNEFDLVAA